jgi:hypothetical protein
MEEVIMEEFVDEIIVEENGEIVRKFNSSRVAIASAKIIRNF